MEPSHIEAGRPSAHNLGLQSLPSSLSYFSQPRFSHLPQLQNKNLCLPTNARRCWLERGVVCEPGKPRHYHGQRSSRLEEDAKQQEGVTLS